MGDDASALYGAVPELRSEDLGAPREEETLSGTSTRQELSLRFDGPDDPAAIARASVDPLGCQSLPRGALGWCTEVKHFFERGDRRAPGILGILRGEAPLLCLPGRRARGWVCHNPSLPCVRTGLDERDRDRRSRFGPPCASVGTPSMEIRKYTIDSH